MATVTLPNKDTFYLDGYLLNLSQGFKDAVLTKNTSAVIVVDGRSGMGKTTLATQLAKFFNPTYDIEQCHFTPNEFLLGLSRAKKGDCVVFDEAMLISSRAALSEVNRAVVQAMAMIRSKCIFVIFCVNSIFDLDRNLALSRADLLLHVYGDNLIDRGNFTAFFKSKGASQNRITQLYLNGKKFYSYAFPKANFAGRFVKKFMLPEDEYEKKKQHAINLYLSQTMTSKKGKRDVYLFNLIKFIHDYNKLSYKKIATEIMQCSEPTIHHVMNQSLMQESYSS